MVGARGLDVPGLERRARGRAPAPAAADHVRARGGPRTRSATSTRASDLLQRRVPLVTYTQPAVSSLPQVTVVGAGLAGCEAAWQLAERGIEVRLLEQK